MRFNQRSEALTLQYDEKYCNRQHAKGKLTARERIDLLFDPESFEELDTFVRPQNNKTLPGSYGDGLVCGHGRINGRKVFAYAQDFNFMGGSLGGKHSLKCVF